eukprot:CAMPEP_0194339662 /NCGR_PEP_ID=MMETSP0171-20130528/83901_1 /TAXON_ID=218684 /ORGANISM="Corethron pennatum, Strain L29A3" /LENGTH=241 /DNA_ID=CAMNT_0039104295 /DNA_START=376 /DNA_END=1097 /DNA_ORIENTATION=-
MLTLPSSPIHSRLQIFDAVTTGLAFAKRLRIYSIYDSLRSSLLLRPRPNVLRLCSCLIPTVTLGSIDYVVLTRRKARSGASSTFSSMWVYPGGHVDLLPSGVAEGPAAAALRELTEETGLDVAAEHASPALLCSYHAVLVRKKRGYFILFYAAPVVVRGDDGRTTTAASLLGKIATDEVSAACLVPVSFLSHVVPRKISGLEHRGDVAGSFEGVEVREDLTVVPATFGAMEIIGDGGEGDG